jgi:hypothetical protein
MKQSNEDKLQKITRSFLVHSNATLKGESFEPKKTDSFIVKIGKPWDIKPYVIKSITQPMISIDGAASEELQLEMYDPITPSTSQAIWNGIRALEAKIPTEMKLPYNFQTKLILEIIGPIGDVVSRWEYTGQFVSFEFGKLDWESQDLSMITATFTVDKCVHHF